MSFDFRTRADLLLALARDLDMEDEVCICEAEQSRGAFYESVMTDLRQGATTRWKDGILAEEYGIQFSYLCGSDRLFHIVREPHWAPFGIVMILRDAEFKELQQSLAQDQQKDDKEIKEKERVTSTTEHLLNAKVWDPELRGAVSILPPSAPATDRSSVVTPVAGGGSDASFPDVAAFSSTALRGLLLGYLHMEERKATTEEEEEEEDSAVDAGLNKENLMRGYPTFASALFATLDRAIERGANK